jgi:hypothetical protein
MADNKKSAWFDETTHACLIEEKARRTESFVAAVADGIVDKKELEDQEKRLIELMKKVEPQLAGPLHEQVTDLLCELTVFNFMQSIHAMDQARAKSGFRG